MCMVKDIFWGISIHALCEEGDLDMLRANLGGLSISIHALCEEGDVANTTGFYYEFLFLSTPSARRATECIIYSGTKQLEFLSTPSARRATTTLTMLLLLSLDFYPRPLRGGRLLCRER